jgi:small subunit ribosomal protein S21
MLRIDVSKEGSFDKALKKWKKKFRDTKQITQLRERKAFKKKSVKKREEKQRAVYKQKLNNND